MAVHMPVRQVGEARPASTMPASDPPAPRPGFRSVEQASPNQPEKDRSSP